ncbi:MAG: ECF-type sigma factor [Planctomycetota bacterium]
MVQIQSSQFAQLMRDVRNGDQTAAAQLLRLYEPEIRRDIRLRLSNPKLRRVVDSMDISQSVFGAFFVRAVYGEFELERPEQLLKLLSKMATNKVIDRHRRETSRRIQDMSDEPVEERDVADQKSPTASQLVSGAELLEQFQRRLTNEENEIAKYRREGISWAEIAKRLGKNADALRKQLTRACSRALSELGE